MIPICWIYWDPKPEIFMIPFFHWPILWYGVLFATGFALGFPIFVHLLVRYFLLTDSKEREMKALKKRALSIADQLTFYIVAGTVLGARIGHFLFYERPLEYIRDPLQLLRIWEGGLASHGGVVGIILATIFFSLKIRSKEKELTPLRLLDFLSVPAALAAVFIRIGNFFNQEVLGTPTDVPWAVLFGHPADRSLAVPRHPAQLYEALFYRTK